MLNLKKTAVAVLALGSSAVFAGTMGPVCTPGSVTVPCEHSAWDFGGKALYLQTTGDDYLTTTSATFGETYQDFDHNWGWGFMLEGSYHFGTGNDINLNWYHFNKTTNQTFGPAQVGGALYISSIEPHWDAVNLEVGQQVMFGEQQNVRFHAGAQYAHIERQFSVAPVGSSAAFVGQTEYNGFGPRFGADLSYNLGNGFAVYGKGEGAMLVGDSKFNNTFVNASVYQSGSRTQIVPELAGRLGVTYTYAMPSGDLILDADYMWTNYFDALHNPLTAGGNTSLINGQTNFALHGVEFGAKWVGNVA